MNAGPLPDTPSWKTDLRTIHEDAASTNAILAEIRDLLKQRPSRQVDQFPQEQPIDPEAHTEFETAADDDMGYGIAYAMSVLLHEPPVGTYLVDRQSDTWKHREDGWCVWDTDALEWKSWSTEWGLIQVYGPFRLPATVELPRVDIEGSDQS